MSAADKEGCIDDCQDVGGGGGGGSIALWYH